MSRRMYVGTFQDPATRPGGESGAVYLIDPDREGEVGSAGLDPSLRAPTYLALHPTAEVLYVVSGDGHGEGNVSACNIDAATGRLQLTRTLSSGGVEPCHLSLSRDASALAVANYGLGTVASFLLTADGQLDRLGEVAVHHGEGPNRDRQTRAHPHMAAIDPVTGNLLVPDLGMDRVVTYGLDDRSGALETRPDLAVALSPGAGPRHLAFLGSGDGAVVANELDSTVVLLGRRNGGFEIRDTASTLPEGYAGENYPSAIRAGADGSLVYVANRLHDSVATFRVLGQAARLELVGHVPCGGQFPRDLIVDADGNQLLVANQNSNTVVSLPLDSAGLPGAPQRSWAVDEPACLVIWDSARR